MAETVQFNLEQMIPELKDLEKKGIFTKKEIKDIIKKRSNFEYALKRRPTQVKDFLKYIEYEMNLEKLRKKRKDRLGIKGKATLSDYAITRRIYYIYDRAIKKFSIILKILRYFYSAIQAHPDKPTFYALAATWEFETNGNIITARALMQRGLRMISTSDELWKEYFKLELSYVNKIRARRAIISLNPTKTESNNMDDSMIEENNNYFQSDNIIPIIPIIIDEKSNSNHNNNHNNNDDDDNVDDDDDNDYGDDGNGTNNKLMQGTIVKIAFSNAIKAIQAHPDKPTFYALAATWEFETNGNIITARALMQRGLRMISTSDELWKEYFKLELSYVNKIRARRAIISLNPTKTESNNMDDSMIEENNNYFQSDNIIPIIPIIIDEKSNSNHNNNHNNNDDDDNVDDDDDNDYGDDGNGTNNKLMQGTIVKIAFSNAIKEFIDICRQYPDTLITFIKDFRNNIEARSFLLKDTFLSRCK
ncbi:hypothetical protein Glove_97g85 [Diversispora epigaea]|uniref:U3 small nucleolar RNA-associated protein 6 N-terminal domain-containing protein n=1 Tax=Diversispora epigaea TaxID=1348612 RepID=A0A397J4P0_9GLOM|nr:hypothetical protein Glove_97g85 [Diversispora epigaea]